MNLDADLGHVQDIGIGGGGCLRGVVFRGTLHIRAGRARVGVGLVDSVGARLIYAAART